MLIGAGAAELPWSKKKHVEQQASKDHGRPGALVTNGHGAVQWAGLERKKQNLMQTARLLKDSEPPSPRRNVRRMFYQNQADTTVFVVGNNPRKCAPEGGSLMTVPQGSTERAGEDNGQIGGLADRPVSAYPSVVTHCISPPKKDASALTSLNASGLQGLTLGESPSTRARQNDPAYEMRLACSDGLVT